MSRDVAYFRVCRAAGGFAVSGMTRASFGHQIPRQNGDRADGIFAEWSWDGRRFQLRNDRYGFYPLYFFSTCHQFAVSPSISKLVELGAPVELDRAGLAVFLRLGFFIGDDTPFSAIRAVPACRSFKWEDGELRIAPVWPRLKTNSLSRDSAIDGYVTLFRQAMRRRLPHRGDAAVPLSGGRDSRHILLELHAAGQPPALCVTAGYDASAMSEEAKVARLLAKTLRIRHVFLRQTKPKLETELRKNVLTNFCADEHSWYLVIADYLRGRIQSVYDGIGGDVLSAGLFLTRELFELFDARRIRDVAERLLSANGENALSRLLAREWRDQFCRELAVSHLVTELERHADAPNPVGSFYFANRTRREIALCPYNIVEGGKLTTYSPYLDHDLYDLLGSLPASLLWDHELHTATIRRAYPAFADIGYAARWKPARSAFSELRRYAWDALRYLHEHRAIKNVRRAYLYPRLLRCMLGRGYGPSVEWLAAPAIYAIQLESLRRGDEVKPR